MGVLTDFVVASPKDAKRVGKSNCPSKDFKGLDAKGIDTVKLGRLHAILTGAKFDPSFMGDARFTASEEGPWVFEVPSAFVTLLAELKDKEIKSVAAKWAKTEEFSPKYDNWPAAAVKQLLTDLVGLSKQAVVEGKAVLMWMCL